MQAVESYLDELVWITENPTNTTAATDAVTVVLDLKNVVFNEILEQDFALCSAMLLNSDKSILNFLQRTATPKHKDLARAREHMFDFLGEYVKLLGQSVQEYALAIKETCLGAFRRELSNRAKVATFAPILNMIELRMQSLDAEKLGVREMAEIYLKDFTCGKSSQTVKSWTLQMLGSFAEYFPEHMFDKSKQLLTLFSDSLLKQFKSKKPDFQLIAGSVKGLTSLLVHFSGDFLADQKTVESIYKYVCLGCLNPPPGLKTYDIPKAALSLVAKHARLFKEYLTEQSEKIYKYITVFCTHKNRAVRKHAFPALDAFLTQVSNEIISDARSAESNRETFKFFMREFWTGLDSRTSGMYDISMCIRGFGLFAKATKRFLGVQEVKKMAQKMISFQHRYFSQASILQVEDTISHLPSFIASFANILLELNEVDDTYVDHLENVIGTFFLVYPQLYDVKRWSYYMAISRLFVALYSKGSALQNLLSRIVFQGLTLTCSKPIVKQSPDSTTSTQPAEYYTEYQDLWRNLLNPRISDELEFSEHQRKDLCKIIYNEFMQSIIRMLQKLVLQYNVVKESAQGEEKTDDKDKEAELLATSEINPNLLKPVVPKDFELFLNLVNFCKMILPQLHQDLFEKWIYIFAKEIIIKSNQFPLVSGFYKLLGVTLKVSDQLKYFEQMDEALPEIDAMTDIDDEPASKATNMDLQTKRVCYTLISKFIQEVETRMKQYKDELLASCLSLVLSVPRAFVTIADKVASLQLCLKLGESYWPLACVALDALEQWTKSLAAQLKPHLSRILPSFNSYLKATTSNVTYVQAQSGQQSALQRIEGVSALTADGEDDKKLKSEIQLRMLRLLAQLGGDNINLIQDVDLATSSSETSIAWDTVKRVKFVVPFQDVKPDVWLDDLLPRIVELAEEASDRQTKVAACELLHSVVLYMIGSNAKLEPVPVHKIYARLFPAMIRLAVDVEQVTRQLFEPLMMQVIHWFTKNQTEENTETMTLLDSIIECVASPSDGAVREFSAKCLTEFLKWSIKQSSKKQQEKNPFNAKSLFKRVYSLMHHPNPYKRMGAYLTVKSLYRVFREEQALVDQFVLELSHALLFSMRLAQHDDTSLGTARLALSVLEALTRIIERHISMLSKPNSARRAHADLNAFLSWVLSQTARSERVVRRAAQGLIARLTAPNAAAWVQKHVLPRRPLSTLIALFEGGVEYEEEDQQDVPQRAVVSHKDALPSLPDLSGVMTWLSRVQASLDLWTWAFSTNMLAPGDVLAVKNGSRLMSWCAHFLTHYQLRSVVTDEQSAHYYLFRPLTPLEIDQFFTQQCSILHLYFKLLHVLLDKHRQASMELLLPSFNESFFTLFFTSILAPEQLGFVANKISQQKKMMALTCNMCRLFTQVLPKSHSELMKKVLRHMLQQPEMNLLTLDFKHSNLDVERARCLVQGYAQLHACELLMDALPKNTNLTEHLLVQAFDHSDNYTPLEMSVGGLTLQLTFSLHPSEKHLHALITALIKLLLDETLVEDRSQPSLEELQSSVRASQRNENDEGDNAPNIESTTVNVKKSTKGEVFYKNFREQIDDFIANNMQYFVKPIMTHIHKNYLMFRVLLNVVDRQVRHRGTNSKAVVQLVIAHLSQLSAWIKLDSTQEQKESALELLKRLMQVSVSAECVSFAREVLCTFMSRAMPLLFKTDVLDLLPALLTAQHSSEQHKKQIRERIRELITYDFPVQSTDLPQDSAVYNEYIACLNKLMQVLVQTGDLMLLEELYPIFRERRHRHMSQLEQQLSQFVKALKHRAEHAVHCFNMIMNVVADPTMTAWLKYNLTRHILLPLYELLPLNHQIQVMQQQIHLLVKTINIEELDTKSSLSAKQSQNSTDDTLTAADVVDRICAFTLIQVMYQCLPSNAIREKINKAYYTKSDAKGNELTTTIMRASHYIKSQQLSVTSSSVFNEGVTRDLLLEYQGTAFNTLAAVVMCTQSKENFFTVFCFKENAAKHEYLWENIVDTDKLWQFEVETNFPVAHKEVTSLLSKYRAAESSAQDKQTNLRYISSQYLADSSLSEDVSNTSFFGKEHDETEHREEADKTRDDTASTSTGSEETGELIELDPINSNPCMLSLLRLIDHLQKQFGATYSKDEMPKWMKELHTKCAAPETHVNIRLFIVKLIVNRAEVFAPYARQWLTPVMKTLLDHWLAVITAAKSQPGPQVDAMDIDQAANSEAEGDKDDEAASTPDTSASATSEQSFGQVLNGFHYFTRDVCIVLLKWSDIGDLNHKPSEEDKHVITQFIEFLMRHCAYHVRGIVYANLQLIRLLIERWKDVLHKTLSKKIVMDYLGYDKKPKAMKISRMTGLHLLSALIYNGFAYYDKTTDHISEAVFLDRLLNNLSGPREVYKSASETIGLALAWDIKHNTRQSALEDQVKDRITVMFSKEDHIRALTSLEAIGKYYPAFIDHFFVRIFGQLKRFISEAKVIALRLILRRLDDIEDPFAKIQPRLSELIRHRDEDAQLVTLQIVFQLLPRVEEAHLSKFIGDLLETFATHPNDKCRDLYYDILLWIYGNREALRSSEELKRSLLQGMSDEDEEIKRKVFNFWDAKILSEQPLDRVQELMGDLFHPKLEHHWLQYTTYLLLNLTNRSVDYDRVMFEALTNCEYREYRIDSSWQFKTAPMTPLFASQSLSQMDMSPSLDAGLSSQSPDASEAFNGIRATQATQGATASMFGFGTALATEFETMNTQDPNKFITLPISTKFKGPTSVNNNNNNVTDTQQPGSPDFKRPMARKRAADADAPGAQPTKRRQVTFDVPGSQESQSSSQSQDLFATPSQSLSAMEQERQIRLQRRFAKTPLSMTQQGGALYAARALRQKKMREAVKRESSRARARHVTLCRAYRAGDLPDVGIAPRDLLRPLATLATRDAPLARLAWSHMMISLVRTLDTKKNTVAAALAPLVRTLLTKVSAAPLVAALLRLASSIALRLPAKSVSAASLRSLTAQAGAVVIETQLLDLLGISSNAPSKDVEETRESWLALSKVYKALREEDILLGLYEKNICKLSLTKEALEAELQGDYTQACKKYTEAINHLDQHGRDKTQWANNPPTDQEVDLWENGLLECYVKLTDWELLNKNTHAEIEGRTEMLWQDNYREPYLGYYVRSSMKIKDKWPELWQFIDKTDEQQKVILEQQFSAELAFIYITRDDLARARYYVNRFYQQFLAQWAALPELQTAGRRILLQSVQRVYELEEYLNFVDKEHNLLNRYRAQGLIKRWRERYPSPHLDDVNVWENVVEQRATLLGKLSERFSAFWSNKLDDTELPEALVSARRRSNQGLSSPLKKINLSEVKHMLIDERVDIYRAMATGARKQGNFSVADKYLRLSLKAKDKDKKKDFDFPFFTSLVKLHCLKAQNSRHNVDAVDKFAKALKYLEGKKHEEVIINQPDNRRKFLMMEGDIYHHLYQLSRDYPAAVVDSANKNHLDELMDKCAVKTVEDQLLQLTLNTYDTAASIVQGVDRSRDASLDQSRDDSAFAASVKSSAKSLLKFGLFCDEAIKSIEDGKKSTQSLEALKEKMIVVILEAMRLGSPAARDRFPRLLQLLYGEAEAKNSVLGESFANTCKTIPCWMFIRWTSQMMAVLSKAEAAFVLPILIEIGEQYPQALYYQFKISSENIAVYQYREGSATMNQLRKLKRAMQHDLLDVFVSQLEKMTHPEHRFKDWTDALKPLMHADVAQRDAAAIKQLWSEIWTDCFDSKQPHLGSYNKQFATTYAKLVEGVFGADGSKLVSLDVTKLNKTLQELSEKMRKNMGSNQTVKQRLTEFSLWLARFDQSEHTQYIELPGQYKGDVKPQPHYHVHIASFDESLLVMGSMRKPKRLKMRGNDERDYPFLVKGGEDLRLDQRIQQLFSVMNQIMMQDTHTSSRRLHLHTYQVIPMTNRVGIIEWLENTKPVKAIIEEELQQQAGSEQSILKIKAAQMHDNWIKNYAKFINTKTPSVSDMYYAMFKHATRKDTTIKMNAQHDTVSWNLLRSGIEALSTSPEAYLILRDTFARSLAVFSICSYIIGIGDRHLDNFLINLKSGAIVGIDFGHAFGTATQFLPIPELIPFRLTRQFTNFLLPLDREGLLKHTMVHTLQALQNGKDILLNTMDVFVQEPLLDWQKLARRLAAAQGAEKDEQQIWFPKKKIEIAKQKLELFNPAYITLGELTASIHHNKNYMAALKDIVLGDPKVNPRALVKEKCQSTTQQVECLIDQATDPNILGRSWGGWASWI